MEFKFYYYLLFTLQYRITKTNIQTVHINILWSGNNEDTCTMHIERVNIARNQIDHMRKFDTLVYIFNPLESGLFGIHSMQSFLYDSDVELHKKFSPDMKRILKCFDC